METLSGNAAQVSEREIEPAVVASCSAGLALKSAVRRDETIRRLGGDGFCFPMTWSADDRQLVAVGDGTGWPEIPKDRPYKRYSSRLFAIDGDPNSAVFEEVAGYPDVPTWEYINGSVPPYYSLGMLAVEGHIYQYLSTCTHRWQEKSDVQFNGAKLIYSTDNGRTWRNQNGSTPVIKELHGSQSRENMAFFLEPQNAFSILTFLQMGKDYRENRDGYVYVYSPNGTTEGTMNELVMFRVPKGQVLDRGAYEFFGGLRTDGGAHWIKDINSRGVVHTFPHGLISPAWPMAWQPSVVYNGPLGLYMMANSNSTGGEALASKPSYLGIWISANPWGPWKQIHEETEWTPQGDANARAGWPQIAPKWIAADGRSFWLVWTDVQQTAPGDFNSPVLKSPNEADFNQNLLRWKKYHPYWSFNTQRFDLVVA